MNNDEQFAKINLGETVTAVFTAQNNHQAIVTGEVWSVEPGDFYIGPVYLGRRGCLSGSLLSIIDHIPWEPPLYSTVTDAMGRAWVHDIPGRWSGDGGGCHWVEFVQEYGPVVVRALPVQEEA